MESSSSSIIISIKHPSHISEENRNFSRKL